MESSGWSKFVQMMSVWVRIKWVEGQWRIQRGSLGSKEPPFCSLNNRKMGVVWLKVGVFHGKLMKRTPLVRVLDPPLWRGQVGGGVRWVESSGTCLPGGKSKG